MAIFLCSDWHFNHDREFIYKARGFNSVDEMNEAIVANHNAIVAPDDTVFALGDCGLGGGTNEILEANKKLIESLNGKITIIRGNHDTDRRVQMYESCKNVVDASLYADMINYRKYHFYLSHFPTLTGNLEKESLHQCTCNLFGHTHQITNFHLDMPYCYHVGMDSHNCFPVNLDDIIEEMKNKVKECIGQM